MQHRRQQLDGDRRAFTDAAVDGDGAAMRGDDVPHDAETDAGAADLRVDGPPAAIERLEDVRQVGGVDAEAAIGDANPHDAVVRRCAVTSTAPPLGLYFTALPTMFCTAERSASASPLDRRQRAVGCDGDRRRRASRASALTPLHRIGDHLRRVDVARGTRIGAPELMPANSITRSTMSPSRRPSVSISDP